MLLFYFAVEQGKSLMCVMEKLKIVSDKLHENPLSSESSTIETFLLL